MAGWSLVTLSLMPDDGLQTSSLASVAGAHASLTQHVSYPSLPRPGKPSVSAQAWPIVRGIWKSYAVPVTLVKSPVGMRIVSVVTTCDECGGGGEEPDAVQRGKSQQAGQSVARAPWTRTACATPSP